MLFSVQCVSYLRHNTYLFQNISYTLHAKETLLIRGQSGVGKSTFVRCLLDLDTFTEGTKKVSKDVAYLPQFDALLSYLTVEMMVRIYAKGVILTKPIQELLAAVDLQGCAQKKIAHLSGGMRKRLAFALTLFSDKRLLVFDEPYVHVGVDTTMHLHTLLLSEQQKRGFGACVVTHSDRINGESLWLG